jgi:hypothetical protein
MKIKYILISTMLALFWSFAMEGFAENIKDEWDPPSAPAATNTPPHTPPNPTDNICRGRCYTQDFSLHGLSVQFRYENGGFKNIRFKNEVDYPIQLTLLGAKHVLYPGDSLIISPPGGEYIYFVHAPYNYIQTVASDILHNRFGDFNIFLLPKQQHLPQGRYISP